MFSVIIPVYNVEIYLPQCLESLQSQTMGQFEAILVDDGSTDNCGQICDAWAKKDKRFRVIHKTNGGLSSARNFGINLAVGDYICFLDSDDFVSRSYFSSLRECIAWTNADCIMFNGYYFIEKEKTKIIQHSGIIEPISGISLMNRMIQSRNLWAPVCFYCYKRSILQNNGLRFKEGILSEDEEFTPRALLCCNKTIYLDECIYNYVFRANSITGTKDVTKICQRLFDMVSTIYELEKLYCEQKEIPDNLFDYLARQYMGSLAQLSQYQKVKPDKQFLRRNCRHLRTLIKRAIFQLSPKLYLRIKENR